MVTGDGWAFPARLRLLCPHPSSLGSPELGFPIYPSLMQGHWAQPMGRQGPVPSTSLSHCGCLSLSRNWWRKTSGQTSQAGGHRPLSRPLSPPTSLLQGPHTCLSAASPAWVPTSSCGVI